MISEDASRKCHFLFSEFVRTRQLTRWLRLRKEKSTKESDIEKDKSLRSTFLFYCLKFYHAASLIARISHSVCSKLLSSIIWNIASLLVIGGIELNPGPDLREDEGFRLRSQNCRGLTDKEQAL